MHRTAPPLGPFRTVTTASLKIGYAESGPADGVPVLLLHGFPYSVTSYREVAPLLAERGYRVLVPHLRGHGPTRFVSSAVPRSGQQAALGRDVIEFMDALGIERAILAGYDWGGRAACAAAALWPERVIGLVSVNGYLIQDIASSGTPVPPELEAGFWYFFYFLTERGRAGLETNRRGIAAVIWRRNSPEWSFDDRTLDAAAAAFDNPDYVDVVLHSYRHRLGAAPGAPEYAELEARLAQLPPIPVPAVTLDGTADGNFPATDGSAPAHRFTAPRVHHQVAHAGHNLPAEVPSAFAEAVLEVHELSRNEVLEPSAEADTEIAVRRDDAAHAYVAALGGDAVAWLSFDEVGDVTGLVRTDVDPAFRGRGIASGLITHVLDELRDRGRRISVRCPQVLRFLAENGQYADLLLVPDPAERGLADRI